MKNKAPDHFSKKNPFLQLAWDATSLSAFMACPRQYYYSMIRGFRGSKIDLDFGIMFASAVERYYKERLAGAALEDAMFAATKQVVQQSWAKDAAQPWGGQYGTFWHCTGTEKYVAPDGSKARKCPNAKAGVWIPGAHPSTCSCGSPIEEARLYEPENKKKNRQSLIRAVVWYCLEQAEAGKNGFQPMRFPDGTPAVELPFRLALPMALSTGERPILCGYFDRLAVLGRGSSAEVFIVDNKTTGGSIGDDYFDHFSPHVQFDTYDLVGSMLFPDLNLRGVINDAVQMQQGSVKFAKRQYYKTEGQRQEHLDLIESTIQQADVAAAWAHEYGQGPDGGAKQPVDAYPMRKSSCYLCGFKAICSKDPATRERYLKADFGEPKERWNPLEER